MYDAKAKLEPVLENGKFIRVDAEHPLELYLGLDSKGNKTLRLNEQFEIKPAKGSAQISIQQFKNDGYNSIHFSNMGEADIFYQFCNDLIDTSRMCIPDNGYQFLFNRYAKWKKMFSGDKNALSLNEIIGLCGELLFLRDKAIDKYGKRDAIMGWSGCEPTHKDFSFDNVWYEIKAMNSAKNTVYISSIEQLDSICDGLMVVYKLEKMSASYNGISLNKLIAEIKELLADEETLDIFENKLIQAGYVYSPSYDDVVFCLMGVDSYNVTRGFPRILRDSVPREIVNIKYDLFLNAIEEFKVKL